MTRIRKYRKHSASGRGFVEIDGRRHYLPGPYGSVESRNAYESLLRQTLAPAIAGDMLPAPGTTGLCGDLITHFLDWADTHYPPGPRGEAANLKHALKHFAEYADLIPVEQFNPRMMEDFQNKMAKKDRQTKPIKDPQKKPKPPQKISRSYINSTCRRIRQMFKWGVSKGIVPAATFHAIQAVAPLKKGRTTARETAKREAVGFADLEATIARAPRPIQGIMWLEWFTGCRTDNARLMRPCEIDRSGAVWLWRPGTHKQAHTGSKLTIAIGPRCQEKIAPYLEGIAEDGFVFRPSTTRQNPRYGSCYSTVSVRQAIERAAKRAGVPHWSPHQLRHARAMEIRQTYGLEAAQSVLGHESIDATQIYAGRQLEVAIRVAAEIG